MNEGIIADTTQEEKVIADLNGGFIVLTRNYRIIVPQYTVEVRDAGAWLVAYSQRDDRWRWEVYSGDCIFDNNGCYVTCVAMVLSLAGYTDTPPEVAEKLRAAGCFEGCYLTRPDLIPVAYPLMRYDGPVDVSQDGHWRWHHRALTDLDWERFVGALGQGPLIIEADFNPGGGFNQHFCVAERLSDDGNDLHIVDPWDGSRTLLLRRYGKEGWTLRRALYGCRRLRVR